MRLFERTRPKPEPQQRNIVAETQLGRRRRRRDWSCDAMVGRQLEFIAAGGSQTKRRFRSGREDAVDEMRLAVAADDERRLTDQSRDPRRAVGGRNAGVAGNARIGRVDAVVVRAGVPLLNGVVELQARIGALPRRHGDLFPEVARLDALDDVAGRSRGQQPIVVAVERRKEAVREANGVVRVLPGNGDVGFGIPGRIVLVDLDARVALARVIERALRRARRNAGGNRFANRCALARR